MKNIKVTSTYEISLGVELALAFSDFLQNASFVFETTITPSVGSPDEVRLNEWLADSEPLCSGLFNSLLDPIKDYLQIVDIQGKGTLVGIAEPDTIRIKLPTQTREELVELVKLFKCWEMVLEELEEDKSSDPDLDETRNSLKEVLKDIKGVL